MNTKKGQHWRARVNAAWAAHFAAAIANEEALLVAEAAQSAASAAAGEASAASKLASLSIQQVLMLRTEEVDERDQWSLPKAVFEEAIAAGRAIAKAELLEATAMRELEAHRVARAAAGRAFSGWMWAAMYGSRVTPELESLRLEIEVAK